MPDYGSELLTLLRRIKDLEKTLQLFPVLLTYNGNPDGALTAREGTFAWDDTNQALYLNVSASEGNDWASVTLGGSGGSQYTIITITNADSPYSLAVQSGTVVLLCDTSGGAITVNLPAIAGAQGQTYHIKNLDVNFITVDASGAETIDGQLAATLNVQWESIFLICAPTEWSIL